MKKTKKIIWIILFIILTTVALVFTLRLYNDYKYGNEGVSKYEYYKNVTDIQLYPKQIDGIDVKYIDEGAFQGFHMNPKNKIYKGVVICYGGSEGSPNFETAERLAKNGYETLAVFIFGMKNQPKTLARIPLEQFKDVLKYVDTFIENKEPITVFGASKGAEYALNLAGKYNRISNVILFAPSAYNFAGLDFNDYGSSWTWENKEIPFIDIKKSSFPALIKNMLIPMLVKSPIQYKETYNSAVDQDLENYTKLIPVADIKANILMIAGAEDQMWESLEMAKMIQSQNNNAVIVSYENAGHIFAGNGVINTPDMRILVGGTLEYNEKARLDSNKIIDDFLQQNHRK